MKTGIGAIVRLDDQIWEVKDINFQIVRPNYEPLDEEEIFYTLLGVTGADRGELVDCFAKPGALISLTEMEVLALAPYLSEEQIKHRCAT